jgi:hypothetical protein
MGLLFNKEIQSQYYQNTSVSVEGASLEWIDEVGGHYDIGQMTASRMLLPPLEICVLSCALKEILIILWRAFLAVVQFGKQQMGRLCLTAVANPSTGRG